VGDVDVMQVIRQDIEAYLLYLRIEYVPQSFGGDTRALSSKTLRNIYVSLVFFFGRVSREFRVESPVKDGPLRTPRTRLSDLSRRMMQRRC
jgi:hypothetical protein